MAMHYCTYAQVAASKTGISPDASAILDVSGNDGGLLIPRMTESERDLISLPAHSLMIYQTDGTTGYYYNSGTAALPIWTPIAGENCSSKTLIDELPFTISTAGSYYLAANLMGSAGEHGIIVNSSNVVIDLNGYTIDGNSKSGNAGIILQTSSINVSIFNGNIVDWGQHGIGGANSDQGKLKYINASNNSFDGISVGDNWVVEYCVASNNGFDGIDVSNSCNVSNCTSADNTSDGIESSSGSNISHCTVENNNTGINAIGANTVSHCNSYNNSNHGYNLGSGSNLQNCTSIDNTGSGYYLNSAVHANDNFARNNGSYGFRILSDSHITSNTCDSNSSDAYYVQSTSNSLEGNLATDHSIGYNIQGSDNLVIKNKASNCTTTHIASGGNLIATFLTSADFSDNSIPHANIEF